MRSRMYALVSLFPLVVLAVSLALATVGLGANEPCPSPGAGGC